MAEINRNTLDGEIEKLTSQMNLNVQVEQAKQARNKEKISDEILETAYKINELIDKWLLLLEKDPNQTWIETYSELREDWMSDEKIIQFLEDHHQEYNKV